MLKEKEDRVQSSRLISLLLPSTAKPPYFTSVCVNRRFKICLISPSKLLLRSRVGALQFLQENPSHGCRFSKGVRLFRQARQTPIHGKRCNNQLDPPFQSLFSDGVKITNPRVKDVASFSPIPGSAGLRQVIVLGF